MQKVFFVILFEMFTCALYGQDSLVATESYSPAMTLSVTVSEKKLTLSSTGNPNLTRKLKGRVDAEKFVREKTFEILKKFDPAPEHLPLVLRFSQKFSEKVGRAYFDKNINTVTRSKDIDKRYAIGETFTVNQDYIIYFEDKKSMLGVLNLLRNVSGVYKYDISAIKTDTGKDRIIEHLSVIDSFVQKNDDIVAPKISIIERGQGGVLRFTNDDLSTDSIAVSKEQLATLKGSKTSIAGMALSDAAGKPVDTIKKAEKKETVKAVPTLAKLGSLKNISCDSTFQFSLNAHTSSTSVDSFVVDLNDFDSTGHLAFLNDVGEIEFVQRILTCQMIRGRTCNNATVVGELKAFHAMVGEALKNMEQKAAAKTVLDSANKIVETMRTTLNNRIDALAAETDMAALVELVETEIPLDVKCFSKQAVDQKAPKYYLKVDSVVIRVFNNLIHQIDIVGTINGKRIQTISNMSYGIGLRELIDGPLFLIFADADGHRHSICPSNLFYVRPTNEDAISYTVRDGVYRFINAEGKRTQVLEQKKLMDFISASAFLDLQAFNETNPNKNLVTELFFNFNIRNVRYRIFKWHYNLTSFRYLTTNITLGANIFKEPNVVSTFRKQDLVFRDSTKIDTATQAPFFHFDSVYTVKYYLKTFDLIRNSFMQVRPVINLISVDKKRSNTFIELNTGILLLGSNVRLVDPTRGKDSMINKPVYSFGPIAEFRYRVNPKVRYGLDLHLIYCPALNAWSQDIYPITGKYELETLVRSNMTGENKSGFLQTELNFYFNPKESPSNTDRGGLYFKLNMFKSIKEKEGHVMVLVGYSTDIKNFFK